MPIRSMKDLVDAVGAGRTHSQRFFKNQGTTGDGQWHDWAYASGQPAFDARVGTALKFTPVSAGGNDAIYFPAIPAGMDRRIVSIDMVAIPGGSGATATEFAMYDLVGVIPLIDGDNTDLQEIDNTLSLPRYSGEAGIVPVLVNHVAPGLAAADMVVEYVNHDGAINTVTWRATVNGQNKVCYTTSGAGTSGPLYCALTGADRGVLRINSIQFLTAPGGLWAIYLVKPLGQFNNRGYSALSIPTANVEYNFATQNGFNMPLVKDGASLGFFFMPSGGARSRGLHGHVHFVWG